jgi:hypothetical protein
LYSKGRPADDVVVCCDVACNILGGIFWTMSGFTPTPALAAAAG